MRPTMRQTMKWTSLFLFSLLGLFMIWFGITYATVRDMLWFHAAAVPEAIRPQIKPLYFALMTLIGTSSGALGLISLWIIWQPLRRRQPGAGVALAVALAIPFVGAAITAERLAAETGAPTSWHLMGVLLAFTTVAFIAHTFGTPSRAAPAASMPAQSLSPDRSS